MSTTEKRDLKLGGKVYKLSYLPFAKNRIVVNAASIALRAIKEANTPGGNPLRLTDIDYMYLAVFEAVNFADPGVSRETFDQMGFSMVELVEALMVVALQTGVLVQGEESAASSKGATAV